MFSDTLCSKYFENGVYFFLRYDKQYTGYNIIESTKVEVHEIEIEILGIIPHLGATTYRERGKNDLSSFILTIPSIICGMRS